MKYVSMAVLLVMAVSLFCIPGAALAADITPAGDAITLSTTYPKIEATAQSPFQFSVEMSYKGAADRVFDLKATPPQGWNLTITPLYETTKMISSITMEASDTFKSQSLQITTGNFYSPPEPGEYVITLEATSGDLTGKIDLTAKVTARYGITAAPADSIYSMTAKSGKDNIYSITVANDGSAPVENIGFTADKTQGWEITFTTTEIAALEPGASKTVDVNIKPAAKTVSGDYMVNIWVSGKQATADKIAVRVTVETSSIWGWVGVIIIVLVVMGLVTVFVRFGRR